MSHPGDNPYTVLDVPHDASSATIKQAYFRLVRAHPPERDPQAFKQIRAAYECLKDPERRLEADMLLPRTWQDSSKRRGPRPDLGLQAADVLAVAAAQSDLARHDWREFYEKVQL